MNIEKRIDELVKIINEADYNYHTLDNPLNCNAYIGQVVNDVLNVRYL